MLNVAVKAADFLYRLFEKPTPELARNAVCPSHYMGTVDLYRTTGDRKYLRLAVKLLDLRDVATGGTDDNQDRVPFRKQTEAVGHAVRANYLYAGAADVYAETGDATLLEPLKKIWANVTARKMSDASFVQQFLVRLDRETGEVTWNCYLCSTSAGPNNNPLAGLANVVLPTLAT